MFSSSVTSWSVSQSEPEREPADRPNEQKGKFCYVNIRHTIKALLALHAYAFMSLIIFLPSFGNTHLIDSLLMLCGFNTLNNLSLIWTQFR